MKRLMKKFILFLTIASLGIFIAGSSFASVYTFVPPDPSHDLYDLDHPYYYTWGINKAFESEITSAFLTIADINDWTNETGDILYIHLLNTVPVGIRSYYDGQGGGDNFSGQGVLLGTYEDKNPPYGNVIPGENITFNIPQSSFSLMSDGNFGFGIDPDCHFYNRGIKLTVTTTPVPEPTSLMLLGMGVLGLFGFRKKAA